MKRRFLGMVLESLFGCILLFGAALTLSGVVPESPKELLAAFGLCWGVVLAVDSVLTLRQGRYNDSIQWDE